MAMSSVIDNTFTKVTNELLLLDAFYNNNYVQNNEVQDS